MLAKLQKNLIRKRTGCDEYVEDQVNVGYKKNTKYLFDDRDCIEYFADSCSIKGCSEKNAILNFMNI